jgi:hypothetical protein
VHMDITVSEVLTHLMDESQFGKDGEEIQIGKTLLWEERNEHFTGPQRTLSEVLSDASVKPA